MAPLPPRERGWTADEILEHVGLTNHFLLILIQKAARKALKNSAGTDLGIAVAQYAFQLEKLQDISQPRAFSWVRPEHMEPTGTCPLAETRVQLRRQEAECLGLLAELPNGEGCFTAPPCR
ncbi:DinB family protein [Hymenobacter rubripertinctus]|uniref:Uncharacterized protein n=1 Tax=Hymenobacter rubripertinctus TaxID=2029981 RepID=A0A418QQ24_9BACT|nr:DinB family protein [Hymenobacter rubripertinctus]RIY07211.1 hypothetical protein D0T11_16855 [Hymenobacter rubripertinctus]